MFWIQCCKKIRLLADHIAFVPAISTIFDDNRSCKLDRREKTGQPFAVESV